MTLAIGYCLVLLCVSLVLFATEIVRIDVAALIVLVLLSAPGVLTPREALAGFGSETILTLITLFVLTEGVIRTGVVERLGLRFASLGSARPLLFARFLVAAAMIVSAFISNTVTTAVFLPIVVGAASRARIPASRLLMPLAFATMLSGTITLIGTSTNLVVAGELPRFGIAPISFFEMAPAGMAIAVAGLLYLWLVAPRLLRDRTGETTERGDSRRYVSEVVVTERSPLAGKTLKDVRLSDVVNLFVVGIRRSAQWILDPGPNARLREGDELLIEGRAKDILSVKDVAGIEIKPEAELTVPEKPSEPPRMVEALVLPRSRMIGRTLREARFLETTGLTVLAMHRAGTRAHVRNISRAVLRAGDVLLAQGSEDALARLAENGLLLLDDLSAHHPRSPKGPWAAAIFIATLALGASGVLALPFAFLIGALALVLTRCLTADEAYACIDWRLLVLIGSMMAFGAAMEKSGASAWVAQSLLGESSRLGPIAVMAGLYWMTVVLSQPMSNQAAALLVLPVAIQAARTLGIEPRPFVITVTLAASCSFLTPLEPASVLVYGAGRYRFSDFFRVGLPLTILVFTITMFVVPHFWPITAVG